jgi:predicted amidohydrolase
MVSEAASKGAQLVVLPELWSSGYFAFGRYEELAEAIDGEITLAMSRWALECGVQLLGGSFVERSRNSDLHNTAVLFDKSGMLVHTYRKMHVFGYQSLEAALLKPGKTIGVVDSDFWTFGTTTCYDLRFPEIYRLLVDQGAQAVLVPAAWPAARLPHWILLTQARALENQVFVLACNAVGEQAGVELAGHSRVIDPWGEVLAEAGSGEEILMCDIDLGRVDEVRSEFPVLEDRRLFVNSDVQDTGGKK